MQVNGTLINYFFHCKRQCYLHGNRINLEDNSQDVHIGKAIHKVKDSKDNTELKIDNIRIDKLTREYLVEVKKSDSNLEAVRWQVLYYLKVLKAKGIERKGKIEFVEKKKSDKKVYYEELTLEKEGQLDIVIKNIENLIAKEYPPIVKFEPKCKKCAYYEYCCI
ncbi:MAG: CRISPR-associated protein Cas4 [Sarcina sp.]